MNGCLPRSGGFRAKARGKVRKDGKDADQ